MINEIFDCLTVIGQAPRKNYRAYWKCRCLCGKEINVLEYNLLKRKIKSCGCRKKPLLTNGQPFDNLKIVKFIEYKNGNYWWLCECICGKQVAYRENHLWDKSYHKSCGCLRKRKEKNLEQVKVGQRFNMLKIIKVKNNNEIIAKCLCGNIKIYSRKQILHSGIKSCGCIGRNSSRAKITREYNLQKKLIGKTFHQLTIIKKIDKKWLCKCSCGNKKTLSTNKINQTKSCGCLWRTSITKHGLYGKPGYTKYLMSNPERKLKRYISNRIRKSLKTGKNGKTFDHLPYTVQQLRQHIENMWEPWMNWDNYGGKLGDDRKTWHIDHIVPHCKFKYTSLTDQAFKKCWALTNLRPLEKHENSRKRCNII